MTIRVTSFTVSLLFFCTSILFVGPAMANTNDIARIASVVVSNGLALARSADSVKSNYTISSVCTNGMALDITASNAFGIGTNGFFVYNLSDLSKPSNVGYGDSAKNGFDYSFYRNGSVGSYEEAKLGKLNGTCIAFYSNGQVRTFCTFSNFFMIGTNYVFDMSGNVSEVITAIPPFEPKVP